MVWVDYSSLLLHPLEDLQGTADGRRINLGEAWAETSE